MPAIISSLAPVQLNSTVLPAESIAVPFGVVEQVHQHSGNIYPTLVGVPGANPRLRIRTPFRGAFDLIGFTSLKLTTCTAQLARFADAERAAGSVHTNLALTTSCIAEATIVGASVTADGILMADVDIVYLSNTGVAHPITVTGSNAALTLASQPILHTLGPVSINGAVIPGVGEVSLATGNEMTVERTDGALYPIVSARIASQPRMTIAHRDPIGALASVGVLGANIATNVIVYFRQYNITTAGGVVDTGASAIGITVASGRIHPVELGVEQGAVGTLGLEVIGLSAVNATHPWAVSVSATAPAIP
jgi:hypothetical protein